MDRTSPNTNGNTEMVPGSGHSAVNKRVYIKHVAISVVNWILGRRAVLVSGIVCSSLKGPLVFFVFCFVVFFLVVVSGAFSFL